MNHTSIWDNFSLTGVAQIVANITSSFGRIPNTHFIQPCKRRDDIGANEMGFEQSNNCFYSIRGAWGELEK
jgi:hypothetical protein